MLRVKKKGRMDKDVRERAGELRAEANAQSYARGFYDSGVIAGLKTETALDVKPRGTLLTDPNFLEAQGGFGQVTVKKRSGLDEFGRGVGIGTRGLVHGVSNVAEPLRQGMNGVNTLLGGDPNYFPPMGNRVGDWLGLPKQQDPAEEFIHSVNSVMGGSAVGIGGAHALAKTAAKAPLNFYPTMAAPATPAPLSQRVGGGESVAEQLAAKPGTQLLGDMTGEMAAQMAQLAGASPLLATAAAVAGSALAGRSAGGGNRNNHFAVNDGPNGGAGRGRAREDIQPERPRREDGEFLGENPQLGKDDGKNKLTQDTSPAFAPSGPLLFEDNKWNFLYGRATGSKHNLDRTAELKKTFDMLGLPENEASKKMLWEHFNEVVSSYPVAWAKESTNLRGPTVTKISHLTGPSGRTATLEITSEVLDDGRFRFMTVVARLHS